jgi:predicted Abi (CAAX) family protease
MRLLYRTRAAFTTGPGRQATFLFVLLVAIYAGAALLLRPWLWWAKPGTLPPRRRLYLLPLILLFRPALFEELIFRVLPLPHPGEQTSRRQTGLTTVISLAAYVVWHPINGRFLRHRAGAVFTDPLFLLLTTLLGVGCTLLYLVSGAILYPVLYHWLVVSIWIVFLGGHRHL